jgi:hypothetical protein
MTTLVRLLLGVLFVALAAGVPGPVAAQQVYTLDPPPEIGSLLDKLRKKQDRVRATFALADRDDAAPYLRHELRLANDKFYKQDLAEALHAIEKRAFERNKKRLAWWATTRRFDLCAELIVACPSDKEAVGLAELTTRAAREVGAEAAERLGIAFGPGPGLWLPSPFSQVTAYTQLADEKVIVPRGYNSSGQTLVRADICELGVNDTHCFFVAVRSGIHYLDPKMLLGNVWLNSIALVNNSMSVRAVESSVIICDGDVELLDLWKERCVIIANGNIRGASHTKWSVLGAAGDILTRRGEKNVLYAGGKVEAPGPTDRVYQKQQALPFGVRFVSPADFGLELAAQNGGMQVLGITPDSPFAKYGVKDGDVITAIDEVAADSIPAFRRQLRRGTLAE